MALPGAAWRVAGSYFAPVVTAGKRSGLSGVALQVLCISFSGGYEFSHVPCAGGGPW